MIFLAYLGLVAAVLSPVPLLMQYVGGPLKLEQREKLECLALLGGGLVLMLIGFL
jgi:hypothetical protein